MTYLVEMHDIYPKNLKYLSGWKDSKWMIDILSTFYDLHLDGLINSFMHN